MCLIRFFGSGSTSVTAKKLGRTYTGVELNEDYCIWAEKRLALADQCPDIQGYAGGVFWERNTAGAQQAARQNIRPECSGPS
ncbi:site-specific DNA-methyltransferase [Brucepastera parasyntrophica]|uniref:site-specific DNA-methyltransferase n=1 Tax=Brucepastera parasyntrophica TaxID=2880008 RepID=UPI00210EFC5F|nr:site-specific DNA-methyltransferase [Brucepastera parasyntrophica]ULQ58449.1 site-specific DNA-methyltransferase [Brucepastera parasyntrophica]